jgi:hypothetical protein
MTLRIVVVAVNPLWLHFFASVVIVPIALTRSPVCRSSRPTLSSWLMSARSNLTRASVSV